MNFKIPIAKRGTLAKVGALLWTVAGCGLLGITYSRFMPAPKYSLLVLAGGFLPAILLYRFALSKLVEFNIARLRRLSPGKDRICMFALINVRSYVMLLLMDCVGYGLRLLQVSRLIMAPAYTAIGLALILASIRYYKLSLEL